MLDNLKDLDYHIIVRPHPQHVRHMPEKMESLKAKYGPLGIEIQTDFSSNSTVFEADMMITDWSGIAYEYAFTTCRPVLTTDSQITLRGDRKSTRLNSSHPSSPRMPSPA